MKILRIAVFVSLLTAMLTFAPSALAGVSTNKSFPVDKATCAMLNRAHPTATDTSCYATVAVHPFADLAPTAYASSCSNYYEDFNIYSGGILVLSDHVNVGLCYNGSTVWRDWGADCTFTAYNPLDGSSVQWCGVYNNGGSYVDPGDNFTIWNWLAPWYTRTGYFRYQVNHYGQITAIWGYCCS